MKSYNLGIKGENLAVKHLENKQYKILERNWRDGHKEIDIIAEKDDTLVIVEVKTRSTDHFEKPKQAVGKNKQRLIIDATETYIINNDVELETRFDIISIIFKGEKHTLEHVEDAYYPQMNQ